MSNQICVKVNGRKSYFSFKWDGDVLLAWIKGEWRAVWRTNQKVDGEYIFELAS